MRGELRDLFLSRTTIVAVAATALAFLSSATTAAACDGKPLSGSSISQSYLEKIVLYADQGKSSQLRTVDGAALQGLVADCLYKNRMYRVVTGDGVVWVNKRHVKVKGNARVRRSGCDTVAKVAVGASRGSNQGCGS
tara:strand:- start:329 stop:739 length:411 start_codon:yes stop_codon:yes gene_type:complete